MTRFCVFALVFIHALAQANTAAEPFTVWIQNLYSVQLTQEKLSLVIAPMEEIIGQPIQVRATSRIKDLEAAIKEKKADMIFWGGYKAVENLTVRNGFSLLAKAQLDVIIYQYRSLNEASQKGANIAILRNSSAWQVMKLHLPDHAQVHVFDDFYGINQHLDSHQIHFVVTTPIFLKSVAATDSSKFIEKHRLKSFAYAAQWIQAKPESAQFRKIQRFLKSKDKDFGQYFGVRFYPQQP